MSCPCVMTSAGSSSLVRKGTALQLCLFMSALLALLQQQHQQLLYSPPGAPDPTPCNLAHFMLIEGPRSRHMQVPGYKSWHQSCSSRSAVPDQADKHDVMYHE